VAQALQALRPSFLPHRVSLVVLLVDGRIPVLPQEVCWHAAGKAAGANTDTVVKLVGVSGITALSKSGTGANTLHLAYEMVSLIFLE
jgi:hypothetical protein